MYNDIPPKRDINEILLWDPSDTKKLKMDMFFLEEVFLVSSEIILIIVSYSGGCRKHKFRLVTFSNVLAEVESTSKIHLILDHDSNGDTCKKLVNEYLYFDLSPLKKKYSEVHGSMAGIINLKIENKEIKYEIDY